MATAFARLLLGSFGIATVSLAAACEWLTGPNADEQPQVWIAQHRLVLRVGDETRLTARYLKSSLSALEDVEDADWRTSDERVIRVRRDGTVTAVGPGVASVSVEHAGARDEVEIRVVEGEPSYDMRWASVSVGRETVCALTTGGEAYCWGADTYGAVADGERRMWTGTYSPVRVVGEIAFASIAVGDFHVCALTPAGDVYCWGDAAGMIGHDIRTALNEPHLVDFGRPFSRLAAGANYNCGLDRDGVAYCWGFAMSGELGDGIIGLHSRTLPHPVKTEMRFVDILPGAIRTCAITLDGRLYCWGDGSFGDLGNGSFDMAAIPVPVAGGHVFRRMTGRGHTCGEDSTGTSWCWGSSHWYQITADSQTVATPVRLPDTKQFDRVIAGTVTTCGLDPGGAAYCWGLDRYGLLGAGGQAGQRCGIDQFPCSDSPIPVAGGLRFQMLGLGLETSCGITVDQALYCWGSNRSGALGAGTPADYSEVPIRVVDPW